MKIVGCDLHTRYQQIAMLDTETGEPIERRVEHANGEAPGFYASLEGPVRVGIEATGHTRWFDRLLAELGLANLAGVVESGGSLRGLARSTRRAIEGCFLSIDTINFLHDPLGPLDGRSNRIPS